MEKFSKQLDEKARAEFMARDEARRTAGRSFAGNRYVRCRQCSYTVTEKDALAANLEVCPQCGSTEPGQVLNLNYDPAFDRAGPVTLKQARATERGNMPRGVR
jgi:acetyl-CoA carboxylase beta subunit